MEFNLEKDLIFFDVETTGLSVIRDRILQIALIKYPKNGGAPIEKTMLINPSIPISEESMNIHGITPKDVAKKPTFQEVAQELYDFIGDADLGGYNSNRFDVPILMEEFARAGFNFSIEKRKLIDVQRVFYKMEPRTLKAAFKFYTGNKLENAHDALVDVRATVDVFKGQLAKYKETDWEDADGNIVHQPIKNNMTAIHEFVNDLRYLEPTQKMKLDTNGVAVFCFGKYNNEPVGESLYKDRNYLSWIMKMEFTTLFKQLCIKYLDEYKKNR